MKSLQILKSTLVGGMSVLTLVHPAAAKIFDVPEGNLAAALVAYMKQSDVNIIYADNVVRGRKSHGAKGDYTETAALNQILQGTGLTTQTMPMNAISIVPEHKPAPEQGTSIKPLKVAAAAPRAPAPGAIETVVVTAEKKSENIQNVPIAITALSQQQLTERQIAGGPDLLRDVPNMNFTKTNFTGYDIQLRGIGTQAISVTTDPAVAVAFNDIPFIRNHFFEQEFYDLQDVEVLLGPQGTLYGRNATAGVVNLKSALPTDTYEAMLSADLGNYSNRRLEGMLNLPIAGDQLDIRIAGEWTKRDGYTEDTTADTSVDGRDLWSSRVSIGWKPASNFQTYLIWEHFSEDDDRLRSGKQLCTTDWGPGGSPSDPGGSILGHAKPIAPGTDFSGDAGDFFSQGCKEGSLYSPSAFGEPLADTLPYVWAGQFYGYVADTPYPGETQSTNLRQIQEDVLPQYKVKNDTLELNSTYQIAPKLSLVSQTGFNNDFLWSFEDYNRFESAPNSFLIPFCDPQLGCSNKLLIDDLSTEHAWQASQEFRLASSFDGPFNFSVGANYLHYETVEDYYVFSNVFTELSCTSAPGCFGPGSTTGSQYNELGNLRTLTIGGYTDPNPLSALNNQGHNYFLSQNPYVLNSYAMFGEAYYNLTNDLKFTTGLRWTDDQKHFVEIPSWLLESGYGYPVAGDLNQQWDQWTGRSVLNWTPQTDFTDQTMVYGSYSHGYKAGGANPPGAIFTTNTGAEPDHPLTFKPEFIDAFEIGSKNMLLDSSLTLNGDIFFYDYKNYQISEIVDRTAINNNYNATADGAELESTWEPMPGLKFSFTGGYENTRINNGQYAIDLMDRTAGQPGWVVVKPFANEASNCIMPTYVAEWIDSGTPIASATATSYCAEAYLLHNDPLTGLPYVANPKVSGYPGQLGQLIGYDGEAIVGYPGFNPATAPNDGEGFAKPLGGNQLPNAPHFTTSLTGEYSMPVSDDWVATFHTDFYWQSQSWWRVFNDNNYDKLHGYSNVNLSLILNSTNGWQVMGYVKNVFNVTAITGAFLNSDDSGLTTNVFLTDPRLYGVRVTKHLDQGDGFWGSDYSGYDFFTGLFSDTDNGKPPLWIELGGDLNRITGQGAVFTPPFLAASAATPIWTGASPTKAQLPPLPAPGEEATVTFEPADSDWQVLATVRYGRSGTVRHEHNQQAPRYYYSSYSHSSHVPGGAALFSDTFGYESEKNLILDFEAGKDVGLGLFGETSNVDLGIRMAQFSSTNGAEINARPDLIPHISARGRHEQYWHSYYFQGRASRKFHGIGPSISWNGSVPVLGFEDREITADWGANGALLFGRQSANVQHRTAGYYFKLKYGVHHVAYQTSKGPIERNRHVLVPNIGGFAGLSYRYQNAKISFGYRADVFFGAMDGGIDSHHSETLNMGGPFANISFGIGG